MHIYTKIYEFSASAGAIEGYVYGKTKISPEEITNWVHNIIAAYQHLPSEVIEEFQTPLDRTLGRAVASLVPVLGEDHDLVLKLNSIIIDHSAKTADDFKFKKWFQE